MNKVKIAHCSDIHLGSRFKNLDPLKSSQREREVEGTFIKTLNICNESGVEILFISGDLFDNSSLDANFADEIKYCISKCKFRTVISPGNHDPFTTDSQYNTSWPKNVYIFKSNNLDYFYFKDINTRVYGNAFTGTYLRGGNIDFEKISVNEDPKILDIGVFHSEIVTGGNENLYSPITLEQIKASKLDYIALGHIHKRSPIKTIGKTSYSYCGCLEGRGFDELGKKGFYMGYVSKGFADLEFVPVCKREYIDFSVNIDNCSNSLEICELVRNKLEKNFGEKYFKNFYKITLFGSSPGDYLLNVRDIEIKMDDLFYIKVIDKTEPFIDLKRMELGLDLKSIFIKKMMVRIDSANSAEEKSIEEKALKIGLKAFLGEVRYDDN